MKNQTAINDLRKQIKSYEAMDKDQPLSDEALARLHTLRRSLAALEADSATELNFRERPFGETSEQGVIDVCPVCNELGARRYSKGLRATLIVHSMVRKAGVRDLVRVGRDRWTDAGSTGRFQIGDFHMLTADGQPVTVSKPQKSNVDIDRGWQTFFNKHIDKKKLAQMVDPDLEPVKQTRQRKAAAPPAKPVAKVVPEWRRLAAQKAWEKIRANRAAAMQAAPVAA